MSARPAEKFGRALAAIDAVHAEDPEKDAAGEAEGTRLRAAHERVAGTARAAGLRRSAARGALPAPAPLGDSAQRLSRGQDRLPALAKGRSRLRTPRSPGKSSRQAGYGAEVKHVQSLVKKERIKHDAEAQLLEDAACLVFLEHEFAGVRREARRSEAGRHPAQDLGEDVAAGAAGGARPAASRAPARHCRESACVAGKRRSSG